MRLGDLLPRAARTAPLLAAALALMGQTTNTVTYTYDSLGRLATASFPDNGRITYTYDNAGNRTVQTVTAVTRPTCTNVSFSVAAGYSAYTNALSNCSSPGGYTLNITSVSPASSTLGTASFDSSGNLTFAAASSAHGQIANLTWTVADPYGVSTTANATVTIN